MSCFGTPWLVCGNTFPCRKRSVFQLGGKYGSDVLVVRNFQHKHKSMGCWWYWFDVLVVRIFQHKRVYLSRGAYALSLMPHHSLELLFMGLSVSLFAFCLVAVARAGPA